MVQPERDAPGPAAQRKPFQPVRFVAVFVAIYAVLHALYFAVPDRVLRQVVHYYAIVAPGAELIRLAAPREPVSAFEGTINSPQASLSIVRGCDGAGIAFLLTAAVLAFPARPQRKLLGVAGALALTYLLNQLRVVGLYFVAAYRHDWFDLLHSFLFPTFIIVVCCVAFAWWASWSAGVQPATAPAR
jgi:exosortase family protein XrtM